MRQKGQAFILVLILLAVGSLLITPALNLASTGLQSRMAQHSKLMEYYATDGAQDYSLWRLNNDPDFIGDIIESGESDPDLYIILNRVQAEYSITLQSPGDVAPSDEPLTTDRYRIKVDVSPSSAVAGEPTEFTYTITLKYMHPDTTDNLTGLWVNFPRQFNYVPDSIEGFASNPPSTPGTDFRWDFTSQPISFNHWEEKFISFRATTTFRMPQDNNMTHYHQAEARVGGIRRGSTGPTAPIIVGSPSETGIPRISMTKTVEPIVILPTDPDNPVGTLLRYTITLENLSSEVAIGVGLVEDALPAGFSYVPDSDTGFLLFTDPNWPKSKFVADFTREMVEWKFTPALDIAAGDNVTGTFQAIGYVYTAGTYANEVWITTTPATAQAYSWPTGGVVVPQFDIESTSGGTTLRVVTIMAGGSHRVKSWQVY